MAMTKDFAMTAAVVIPVIAIAMGEPARDLIKTPGIGSTSGLQVRLKPGPRLAIWIGLFFFVALLLLQTVAEYQCLDFVRHITTDSSPCSAHGQIADSKADGFVILTIALSMVWLFVVPGVSAFFGLVFDALRPRKNSVPEQAPDGETTFGGGGSAGTAGAGGTVSPVADGDKRSPTTDQ